jgi:hypothetical protein
MIIVQGISLMPLLMFGQLSFLLKALTALLTLERLLPGVNPEMIFKIAALIEFAAAHTAY